MVVAANCYSACKPPELKQKSLNKSITISLVRLNHCLDKERKEWRLKIFNRLPTSKEHGYMTSKPYKKFDIYIN